MRPAGAGHNKNKKKLQRPAPATTSSPLKRTRPIGRDLSAQKALADRRDRRTPLTGELKKAWGVPELWRALQKHRAELNGLNTSFALNKLAKLLGRQAAPGSPEAEKALHLLEAALHRDIHTYSARSLATAMHAISKMQGGGMASSLPRAAVYGLAQQRALRLMHDFTPQGLSNLLFAFANAGAGPEAAALFDAAAPQAVRMADRFRPAEISTTLWSYRVCGRGDATAQVAAALLLEAAVNAAKLSPDEITTVAWAVSSKAAARPAGEALALFFAAAEKQVLRRERQFAPYTLVRLVRSFASAQQPAEDLLEIVERQVAARPANFSGRELALLARSCASLGHSSRTFFAILGHEAALRAESFRPRELASMVRAAANLGCSAKELFVVVEARFIGDPGAFSSQETAMICRAFGMTEEHSEELFRAVRGEVVRRPEEFKPQELASVLWAHGNVESCGPPEFFEAVDRRVAELESTFKPQEISNVVWGYASLEQDSDAVFEAVVALLLAKPEAFIAHDISNLAWALAKLGRSDDVRLLEAIEARGASICGTFTPQGIATVCWAFSALGRTAPGLFGALEPAVQRVARENRFSAQGLALVLRGYARQGQRPPELFQALSEATMQRINQFTPMGLRWAVWAFAVASQDQGGEGLASVLESLSPAVEARASAFTLKELTHVLRAYARSGVLPTGLMSVLGRQLRLRAEEAAAAEEAVLVARSVSTMRGPNEGALAPVRSQLLKTLAGPLAARAPQCPPKLLVIAARAYGLQLCMAPELFDALAESAARQAGRFTARELLDIVEAFRIMGYASPVMMGAFEQALLESGRILAEVPVKDNISNNNSDAAATSLLYFSPAKIAALGRAFAQLGFGGPGVVVALQHHLMAALERGAELSNEDAALVQDAFAMLGTSAYSPYSSTDSQQLGT